MTIRSIPILALTVALLPGCAQAQERGEGARSDWGRPVDVLVMPDGALLVSDDDNGVIYRITYGTGS